MNMGTTLAVYATLCKETGRPFYFLGSGTQWDSLTDMTDARLLARHMLWATETPEARNEAFNVVNGDVFRWSWMWQRIAEWFGLKAMPFDGTVRPIEDQMADDAQLWRQVAEGQGLAVLFILDRLKVKWLSAYLLVGAVVWYFVFKSGIHATLAGVATALFIPLHTHKKGGDDDHH